ncbi:origin recognition complex subunit 2 [Ophiostoma piceae UAMH 11346]|uniref:Origin recognition complex subunit 2 n=1 Tax=Ophiostoma piceae (strain UAMH 11346) TaxID=1262450 RepID=S3C9U8_OPHP1|nr:origin recognition complex subunit 2 [Ophiostoma piceae UAMH 11346]
MARTTANGGSPNGTTPASTTASAPLSRLSPEVNRIISPSTDSYQLQNGSTYGVANGVENQSPHPSTPTKRPWARKTALSSAGGSGRRIQTGNEDDFSLGDVPKPGGFENAVSNGNGLPLQAQTKSSAGDAAHLAEDAQMTDVHEAIINVHPPAEDQQQPQEPKGAPEPVATPRKRGRPRTRFDDDATKTTPKRQRADPFSTPTKATPSRATPGTGRGRARPRMTETPSTRRTMADRSARKKTTRALIDRMVAEDVEDEDEEMLGAAILGADYDDDTEEEDGVSIGRGITEPAAQANGDGGLAPIPEGALEEAVEEPEEPEGPVAPTPRKRGRPPKNAAKQGGASVSRPKLAKAPPTPVDPNAPPKRGRGRPRKTDTTAPGATATPAVRELEAPRDQPAHEHFFFHNRSGAAGKTSNNTLAALRPLTYEEYFRLRDGGPDSDITGSSRHETQITYLEDLHAQSFPQWAFELSQGYSVCLYGYGSKQRVLRAFAKSLHKSIRDHQKHKIVMANASPASATVAEAAATSGAAAAGGAGGGGAPASASAAASTLRDILLVVAAAASNFKSKDGPPKLPTGAAAAEKTLLSMLDQAASSLSTTTITLLINGIDSPSLRRPAAQATLARLAAHPSIQLLCAADTPGFALMWDGAARSQHNFVFHDATTFRPLAGLDTVDEVHVLLGRRVRRVGGKDGAAFVLRSLPENARNLFQLLIGEVLAADDGSGGGGGRRGHGGDDGDGDDEYDNYDGYDNEREGGEDNAESVALEYRMLYNKAVEEFICSSEMSFRTLLKEFHDHQMVTSRKDAFGTEMLSLPFRHDELEGLLEELAS